MHREPQHVLALRLLRRLRGCVITVEVIGDEIYGSKKRPAHWRGHIPRLIATVQQHCEGRELITRHGEKGYKLSTPDPAERRQHHVRFTPGNGPRAGK